MVFNLQTEDDAKAFVDRFKEACNKAGGTFNEELKGTVHNATCTLANDAKIFVSVNAAENTNIYEPVVEVKVTADVPDDYGDIEVSEVFTGASCSVEPSDSGHQMLHCSAYGDHPHSYEQSITIHFKKDNVQINKKTAPLGLRNIPNSSTYIDLFLEEW